MRVDGIALGSNPPLATAGSVDLRTTLGDKEIAIDQTGANNIRVAADLLAPNANKVQPIGRMAAIRHAMKAFS